MSLSAPLTEHMQDVLDSLFLRSSLDEDSELILSAKHHKNYRLRGLRILEQDALARASHHHHGVQNQLASPLYG
jgi:hypothetical protein